MDVKIVEYTKTAAALGELRQRYENVIFPVSTTAGMKDATAARKELRDIRVGLEKMRKDIKAPALERCRLIDEEAKTITAQLVALEDPIDSQIKAEEARKEREKQERERIERERVEGIRKKIDGIRALPVSMSGQPAAEIAAEIEALEQFTPGDQFAEFVVDAATAKANALDALRGMHERQAAQEAEAARMAAERAELERLRAEAAERQRQEDERRQQEEARLAAERAEIERQRAELEAAQKAAQAKGQETTAEPAPVEPEPVAARITAMGYDIACATDAIAEHLIAVKGESLPPEAVSEVARPSDEEIIDVVAKHYGVSPSTAHGWLADFNATAVIGRLVEAA